MEQLLTTLAAMGYVVRLAQARHGNRPMYEAEVTKGTHTGKAACPQGLHEGWMPAIVEALRACVQDATDAGWEAAPAAQQPVDVQVRLKESAYVDRIAELVQQVADWKDGHDHWLDYLRTHPRVGHGVVVSRGTAQGIVWVVDFGPQADAHASRYAYEWIQGVPGKLPAGTHGWTVLLTDIHPKLRVEWRGGDLPAAEAVQP